MAHMFRLLGLLALLVPYTSAAMNGIGLARVAIASGKKYFGTATDNPGEFPGIPISDVVS